MLRNDVLNYEASNNCVDGNSKHKLLVRLPVAVGENLNPSSRWLDLFTTQQFDADDTDDYLYLKLFPEYTQQNDVFGEERLKNTFNSAAVFSPATRRRGFIARITDKRLLILEIIRTLAINSRTSSFTLFSPIKVVDYCLPEIGESYTIRYGAINNTSLPGLRKGHLSGEWEFEFKEAELRDF